MHMKHTTVMGAVAIAGLGFLGCSKTPDKAAPAAPPANQVAGEGHSHDGWWCDDHGVPEDVCTRCDPSLVADFKAKNDWCKAHDRPDSQCFICHPEREGEFALTYEEKYGKQPPKPDAEG